MIDFTLRCFVVYIYIFLSNQVFSLFLWPKSSMTKNFCYDVIRLTQVYLVNWLKMNCLHARKCIYSSISHFLIWIFKICHREGHKNCNSLNYHWRLVPKKQIPHRPPHENIQIYSLTQESWCLQTDKKSSWLFLLVAVVVVVIVVAV